MNYQSQSVRNLFLHIFRGHRMRLESLVPAEPISIKALSLNPFKTKQVVGNVQLLRAPSDEVRMFCSCGWQSHVFSYTARKGVDWDLAEDHVLEALDKELAGVPA